MSCVSKTVKAMAIAAAMASTMRAPTCGSRFLSIEIDESGTGKLVVSFTLDLGTIGTLTGTGAGLDCASAGLARTTGGLFGLISADPSEEWAVFDESNGFAASADSTCPASDTGLVLPVPSLLEFATGVSTVFSF